MKMLEQWVIWCGTDIEQNALAAAFGNDCISVYGSLSPAEKVRRETEWREGRVRVLITKPSILGWGVNYQHCANMIFVGLSDSWEAYFQCIRRCWRFGQSSEVRAYVILSEAEQDIWDNVMKKERQAMEMSRQLIKHVRDYERAELGIAEQRDEYDPQQEMLLPAWLHST